MHQTQGDRNPILRAQGSEREEKTGNLIQFFYSSQSETLFPNRWSTKSHCTILYVAQFQKDERLQTLILLTSRETKTNETAEKRHAFLVFSLCKIMQLLQLELQLPFTEHLAVGTDTVQRSFIYILT